MLETTANEAGDYGRLVTPETVRISRHLPGPRERVWRYLTEPDLRRKWLGAGAFDLVPGGAVELVFRNGDLAPDDDPAPVAFADRPEMRLSGVITACDPPSLLAYTWGTGPDASEVRFELDGDAGGVRLTVTHARLARRGERLMVSAGWHTHLDILVALLSERTPDGFWRRFTALEQVYDSRLPE